MSVTDHGQSEATRIAVVAEAFLEKPLAELLEWLGDAAPEVTGLELGAGGYAPHPHCDRDRLLNDAAARREWLGRIEDRGFAVCALNAWGNPLHPNRELARAHDRDLRKAIRLAAALGVDRVVALAGCPGVAPGERTPHFAAGGWLPYLEGIYERQWEDAVAPYWSELTEFARAEHPELLICIELHPGTVVYNVDTFSQLAALAPNLAANLDPSHFFWMQMDPLAVVEAIGDRIGHVHAKDVKFDERSLALNGLLDRRWSGARSEGLPWKFAIVGASHDATWWSELVQRLAASPVRSIAIEHEDPDVPAEVGVPEVAGLLAPTLGSHRRQLSLSSEWRR